MFRFAILAFVALRVTLCPHFCAANANAALCQQATSVCCCCDSSSDYEGTCAEPFGSSNRPCDSEHPCCPGNVCQVIIDVNPRLAEVPNIQLVDVLPMVAHDDATPIAGDFLIDDKECRHPFRSGRDLRLVYASLLL